MYTILLIEHNLFTIFDIFIYKDLHSQPLILYKHDKITYNTICFYNITRLIGKSVDAKLIQLFTAYKYLLNTFLYIIQFNLFFFETNKYFSIRIIHTRIQKNFIIHVSIYNLCMMLIAW